MKIRTPYMELPFRTFAFPDGQRHFELQLHPTEAESFAATIETAIGSADDLLDVLLAKDALDASGFRTALDIRYLLGARMDRRIDFSQPATLGIVARLLRGAGFTSIRVLDPHSDVSLKLLGASAVYPTAIARSIIGAYDPQSTIAIAPDKGATERVNRLVGGLLNVVLCRKTRDSATGGLSGFAVEDASAVNGKVCLILDDICDGGWTFVGLARELVEAGACAVDLFVTHGIFSKGTPLDGIRKLYATDSLPSATRRDVILVPISMQALR